MTNPSQFAAGSHKIESLLDVMMQGVQLSKNRAVRELCGWNGIGYWFGKVYCPQALVSRVEPISSLLLLRSGGLLTNLVRAYRSQFHEKGFFKYRETQQHSNELVRLVQHLRLIAESSGKCSSRSG